MLLRIAVDGQKKPAYNGWERINECPYIIWMLENYGCWRGDCLLDDLVEMFKALADETRLRVFESLIGRELCVCELVDVLEMTQPAVSHHLGILKRVGLVQGRRSGKWMYYSVRLEGIEQFAALLQGRMLGPIRNTPLTPASHNPRCETEFMTTEGEG